MTPKEWSEDILKPVSVPKATEDYLEAKLQIAMGEAYLAGMKRAQDSCINHQAGVIDFCTQLVGDTWIKGQFKTAEEFINLVQQEMLKAKAGLSHQ